MAKKGKILISFQHIKLFEKFSYVFEEFAHVTEGNKNDSHKIKTIFKHLKENTNFAIFRLYLMLTDSLLLKTNKINFWNITIKLFLCCVRKAIA